MRLYDISQAIEALLDASVDRETGEINEAALAELEALEEQREAKALAVAAYLVGQRLEADAIKAQAKRLAERAAVHARHADRLERYLESHLAVGEKLSDARVALSWRKSRAVEVDCDPTELPEEYCRIRCEADKTALKAALESGEQVKGVRLVERQNLQVK